MPYNPAIPLLGIYPMETRIERDTCTQMFIAVLFTIIRRWNQPRCPLTDEWIRKLWYIHMKGKTWKQGQDRFPLLGLFRLLRPRGLEPTGLLCPLDVPGKDTGLGYHFLLQGNIPDSGIEPGSPVLQVDSLPTGLQGKLFFAYTVRFL